MLHFNVDLKHLVLNRGCRNSSTNVNVTTEFKCNFLLIRQVERLQGRYGDEGDFLRVGHVREGDGGHLERPQASLRTTSRLRPS